MRPSILATAFLAVSFVPAGVGADISAGGVNVHVFTDIQNWTSSGTTIDSTTAFAVSGSNITLTTASDTFANSLNQASCVVTVRLNGAIVATLDCSVTAAYRVVYAADVSTMVGKVITPTAVAGFADFGYGNSAVGYHHRVYNRESGRVCSDDSRPYEANPSTYVDDGLPNTHCCVANQHVDGLIEVTASDGWSYSAIREIGVGGALCDQT